jgi:hemerythrin-like domain-containing protein
MICITNLHEANQYFLTAFLFILLLHILGRIIKDFFILYSNNHCTFVLLICWKVGKIKPIKRSKELVSLSRDHHDGLLLCWKINNGLDKEVAPVRIAAYVLSFFDNNLSGHFEMEEQYLFPLLGEDNGYRKEAQSHHVLLCDIITQLRRDGAHTLLLRYFAEILHTHIRFEERVLFNTIQEESDIVALKSIEEKLRKHGPPNGEWHDQFWLNDNNKICSQRPANTA